ALENRSLFFACACAEGNAPAASNDPVAARNNRRLKREPIEVSSEVRVWRRGVVVLYSRTMLRKSRTRTNAASTSARALELGLRRRRRAAPLPRARIGCCVDCLVRR